MVRRVLKCSTVIVLGIALMSGIFDFPASAEVPGHSPRGKGHAVMKGPGKVRLCTRTAKPGCYARGVWPTGAHVKVLCRKGGSKVIGRFRSSWWYYIANGGRRGFVHSSWVGGEGRHVRSCRGNKGAMAMQWAAKRVGEVAAKARERGLSIANNQWSGWCAAFTRAAYSLGAGFSGRYAGNARPRYFLYRRAGRMKPWNPWKAKMGSMVFWPNASSFGHTAIYAGRGYVITTTGSTGWRRPVSILPATWYGRPAGWVPPKDV